MPIYRFSAPAKVNLSLRITGRRPDGYHLLRSVMTFFPLYDTLEVERRPEGIHLTCMPAVTHGMEENLVYRAANRLREAAGVRYGARLTLHKRIPTAAGLGGGSSDAATALLALNQLWQLGLMPEELLQLGAQIGADIPFFLSGMTALAEGIGEQLTPLPTLPSFSLLIVNPGFPLSTKDVFLCFAEILTTAPNRPNMGGSVGTEASDLWVNDLEEVSCRLASAIMQIKENLRSVGAVVTMMSGSGPSVCGLFPDQAAAQGAAAVLKQRYPGWQFFSGNTFQQHPFQQEWLAQEKRAKPIDK